MIFRRVLILLMMVCVLVSIIIAQVHIKERVEITPSNSIQTNTGEPVAPVLYFNDVITTSFQINYSDSVRLRVEFFGVIGSVRPLSLNLKQLTTGPSHSVQTGRKCTVSVDNSDGVYLGCFITSSHDTVRPSNGSLQIEVYESNEFYYVAKGTPPDDETASITFKLYYPDSWYGTTYQYLKIENKRIMLGQAKYYYTQTDDSNNLSIHSTTSKTFTNLFSYNVFDSLYAPAGSEKQPCYWEKKDSDGTDLPTGVIRVIGRYWEQGKTFKAVITASAAGYTSATDTIEVKKPARLGNTYSLAMNVSSSGTFSIDDSAIVYAGKYGIPPQFIKGQFYQESIHDNNQLWPSYRYEPWQDRRFRVVRTLKNGTTTEAYVQDYMSQPFWVTETSMGTGNAVPTNHQNVRPTLSFSGGNAYPRSPMKLGKYIADNLDKYCNGSGLDRTFSGGKIGGPPELDIKWNEIKRKYKDNSNQEQLALVKFKQYLIDSYKENAQTRKTASYGYYQMLYTTAITSPRYPKDGIHEPEALMLPEVSLQLGTKFMVKNIKAVIGSESLYDSGSWSKGFEYVLLDSYKLFNDRPGYNKEVINNAQLFLPKAQ